MKYYTIQPSPALAQFVRFFWVFENEGTPEKPYIYRSMADGCAELIFHYKGSFNEIAGKGLERSPLSHIHSQSTTYREFVTSERFGIFGVYLYPYAIPYLFSLPSTDFNNLMPDLDTIWSRDAKELEENIMLAANNFNRVKILSDFIAKKIYACKIKDSAVQHSIKYIIHSGATEKVSSLSEKYNLSQRQYERKFKEYSGFSPKLFSRIIRFQSTLKEYGKNRTLTEIASKCGYFDQSHFNREFKLFSGCLPKEYFVCTRNDAALRV
ncbi:MAG: helix-turn-helix domain-containing protein [Ignavibacteriaceae bacterium]